MFHSRKRTLLECQAVCLSAQGIKRHSSNSLSQPQWPSQQMEFLGQQQMQKEQLISKAFYSKSKSSRCIYIKYLVLSMVYDFFPHSLKLKKKWGEGTTHHITLLIKVIFDIVSKYSSKGTHLWLAVCQPVSCAQHSFSFHSSQMAQDKTRNSQLFQS